MTTATEKPTRDDLVQEVEQLPERGTGRTACELMPDDQCDGFATCQECSAWVPPRMGQRA